MRQDHAYDHAPGKSRASMLLGCLLTVGLTSAYTTAQAQTSITLYGIADGGLQYTNNVGIAQNTAKAGTPAVLANKSRLSFQSGGDYASRWGLLGSEDLGAGTKAFFQLENGFNIGTGAFVTANTEFNRYAFVGLSNPQYGKLSLGRQYEAITDMLGYLRPTLFVNGIGTSPGDITNGDGSVRVNNSVKYVTPAFNGLKAEAMYGFGGAAGSLNTNSTTSTGVQYLNGPFAAGIAYLRMDNSAATGNAWGGTGDGIYNNSVLAGFAGSRTVQLLDAAAGYQFSKVLVSLYYGYTQFRPQAVSVFAHPIGFNTAGLFAKYQVTPQLLLGLGGTWTLGQAVVANASRPHYEQVTASGYYSFTKRTLVYALAGFQKASGKTLDAFGNVVNATASVGDAATGFSSGSGSQLLIKVGFANQF